MKILLISGFLGAGKTSFIKSLAKNTNREFVIIENEFADLNIDGQILKQQEKNSKDQKIKVWEMSEGCICCSINLDFTHSLLTIANTLNPDYLIIEPSGVALPSNIIANISKVCYEKIELLPTITILDGIHYKSTQRDYNSYFNDQILRADRIIVSKSEGFTEQDFVRIKADITVNSSTKFIAKHYNDWDKATWFDILDTDEHREYIKQEYGIGDILEDQKLENVSIKSVNLANPVALIRCLNILNSGVVGKVIRAKGFFRSKNGEYLKFDLVDGLYSISQSESAGDNKIVVIGSNLNKISIKLLFANTKMMLVE